MPNLNINMAKSTCYRMLFLSGLEKRHREKDNNRAQCTINQTGPPEVCHTSSTKANLPSCRSPGLPLQLRLITWDFTATFCLYTCLFWCVSGWVPVEKDNKQYCWHSSVVDHQQGAALILRPAVDDEDVLEVAAVPLAELLEETLELIGTNVNGNPYGEGGRDGGRDCAASFLGLSLLRGRQVPVDPLR